jgi:prepilin-type N-terminal cleavage/methylation domain-containing protein
MKKEYIISCCGKSAFINTLKTMLLISQDLKSYLRFSFCHSGLSRIFLHFKRKDSRQAGMTTIGTEFAMNNRGVTLLELLIVIAIIGILAMAATTAYIGVMKKAARSEAYANLESLRLLEEQFFAENAQYTISLGAAGNTFAVRDANLNDIQDTTNAHPPDALRGFQPSGEANFSYRIIQNVALTPPPIVVPWDGATQNQDPCFIAVAEGILNTRVAGDIFAIDCNNNRNF